MLVKILLLKYKLNMQTKLLCLENTYNYSCTAKVVETGIFNEIAFVILDQTVFYPQGGGQPSDIGTIESDGSVFEVSKCQIIDDECHHFGAFTNGELKVGDEVLVKIDSTKRDLHARIHTAGHLIDLGLAQLGFDLHPTKGYHFPAGPYIEYGGTLPQDPDLTQKLEKVLAEIIATDTKTNFEIVQGTHENGKPMRIMHLEGYPDCGCGGTHVEHLGQIGMIKIRKIKGNRVAYEVV